MSTSLIVLIHVYTTSASRTKESGSLPTGQLPEDKSAPIILH